MKITVLAENTSKTGLPCEHGLSLYIETGNDVILFDMGQTDLFSQNAAVLGCSLDKVSLAVISHGHYDHGGGLGTFLKANGHAPVYISKYAFGPHYNASDKYIGLDISLKDNERLIPCEGTTVIGQGLTLYSCSDRKKLIDMGCSGLQEMKNGQLVPDEFRHEHYLLIEENGRRVLISGCSHRGIINIMEWFRPDVLVGGFHFMKMSVGKTLATYAAKLDSYSTTYYTCHCTGTEQYEFMSLSMKRLNYISTGDSFTIN